MNTQEAQKIALSHMGAKAPGTVLLALICLAGYLSATYMITVSAVYIPWGVAVLALCTYACYTPLHEASHGNIAGQHRKWLSVNHLAGALMGWIIGIPYTSHRRLHLKHHQHTNNADKDPDIIFAAHTPMQGLKALVKTIPVQYHYGFFGDLGSKERFGFLLETLIIIGSRLYIFAVAADPLVTGVSLLVGHTVGTAVLITLFAWIVHHPHTAQERMLTTVVFETRGATNTLMTWLWGFQNYHAIHHLYPKIPFYHYRRVHSEMRDYLTNSGVPHVRF